MQIGSLSPADALAQDASSDAPKKSKTEPPFISDPVAPPPPIHGKVASAPCKATHHHQRKPGTLYPPIRSVYITAPYPFEEMEEFVLDSVQVYNLDLWRFGGGMKAALEEYLKCEGGKDVKGILVGTRRGDPNGGVFPHAASSLTTKFRYPSSLKPILHGLNSYESTQSCTGPTKTSGTSSKSSTCPGVAYMTAATLRWGPPTTAFQIHY